MVRAVPAGCPAPPAFRERRHRGLARSPQNPLDIVGERPPVWMNKEHTRAGWYAAAELRRNLVEAAEAQERPLWSRRRTRCRFVPEAVNVNNRQR
jgi:hypothetical protein